MTTYAVWQATVTDNSGNIADGAVVTVRSESTGLVSDIFDTRIGTAKTNPFTTGADGFAQFYAAPGLYRIEAEYSGNFIEWRNVRLVEVATSTEAIAGTAGVLPDAAGVHAAFGMFGLGKEDGDANTFSGDLDTLRNQQEVYIISSGSSNLPVDRNGYLKVTPSSFSGFVKHEFTAGFGAGFRGRTFSRVEDSGAGGWQPWVETHTGANMQPDLANGLNSPRLMRNMSGATVNNEANVGGSGLRFCYFSTTGVITASATSGTGTWKNISGTALAANEYGFFVRIA